MKKLKITSLVWTIVGISFFLSSYFIPKEEEAFHGDDPIGAFIADPTNINQYYFVIASGEKIGPYKCPDDRPYFNSYEGICSYKAPPSGHSFNTSFCDSTTLSKFLCLRLC